LATSNKDFKIKHGLIVQGTNATVNGNDVITSASSINELSDIELTTPGNTDVLTYDEQSGVWENKPVNEVGLIGRYNYQVRIPPPENPSEGEPWFNSHTGRFYIYYDGYWIENTSNLVGGAGGGGGGTGNITVSQDAPENPAEGDLWFNSTNTITYIYYDGFWIEANPSQPGPEGPAGEPGIVVGEEEPEDTDVLWLDSDDPAVSAVPPGGTTGEVLVKASNSNYDTEWKRLSIEDNYILNLMGAV
jgi:hypothetical protein